MKIRHQIETPIVEETKEATKRLRDNKWLPAIVMTIVTLAAVRAGRQEITTNIYNYNPDENEI